jgi:hypothetical protein
MALSSVTSAPCAMALSKRVLKTLLSRSWVNYVF